MSSSLSVLSLSLGWSSISVSLEEFGHVTQMLVSNPADSGVQKAEIDVPRCTGPVHGQPELCWVCQMGAENTKTLQIFQAGISIHAQGRLHLVAPLHKQCHSDTSEPCSALVCALKHKCSD